MKAAIYCRVSTDDQEKEGTSLQTQKAACLAYCQQKGYEVIRQFSETYSGLTLERPELIKLRGLVATNQIDAIVVYCLDRLSRDPAHGAMLFQQFEEHHVKLEAVTETIENTDLGKLISYIRGFASKVEADKIRERTMRGKLARLKEGKLPHGTGKGIFGYDWNKHTGKRTINDQEAKTVLSIFLQIIKGASFHKIALELNKAGIRSKAGSLWHPLTIKRIATNETYTGKTYSGKTKRVSRSKVIFKPQDEWFLLPNVTPQIISEEAFKQVQETILNTKQSRPVKKNAAYLLTGFAKCPKCGSPLGGTTLGGKYRYYQCRGARPTTTRGKICDAGYVRADFLENQVWNKVSELLSSPLTVLSMLTDSETAKRRQPEKHDLIASLDKEITHFRKRLKTYPDKEKNLYDLLINESVTKEYVLDAVNRLKQERTNDERQLNNLLETRKETTTADRVTLKLSEFSNILDEGALQTGLDFDNLELKRGLLQNLQFKLLVTSDPMDFKFTLQLPGQIISSEATDNETSFNKAFIDYAQQNPDVAITDVLDVNKPIPGDSLFAQTVNRVKKDLVTIEQTSA